MGNTSNITCDNENYQHCQIVNALRLAGKNESEIESFVEKYNESRKKLKKYIKVINNKIGRINNETGKNYNYLDICNLVVKGVEFANKNGLTKKEEIDFNYEIAKNFDISYQYSETKYSEMSKLLDISSIPSSVNIKSIDTDILDKIFLLFNRSKGIYEAIKHNLHLHNLCIQEVISCNYEIITNNKTVYIHPIIVALFMPKLKAIENRMLFSNIGRIVAQIASRSELASELLKKYQVSPSSTSEEIESDCDLIKDIIKDPNSSNEFSNDTSLSNLLKRFEIQIELCRNVLSLRYRKYYSKNDCDKSDKSDENNECDERVECVERDERDELDESESDESIDYVSGLNKKLNGYEYPYYDSPEDSLVQDEGTFLKKLLSVFSLRPTFTLLSTLGSLFDNKKVTYDNIPIVAVKLPKSQNVTNAPILQSVKLSSALSKFDNVIVNKKINCMHRNVINSKDLLFFYVNRRLGWYLNKTDVEFNIILDINNSEFYLRSIVIINSDGIGCSSIIINHSKTGTENNYIYYNPMNKTKVVSLIPERNNDENNLGFYELGRKYGVIFIYSKEMF